MTLLQRLGFWKGAAARPAAGGQAETDWHRVLKRRVAIAGGGLLMWALFIEARLVHLQVFQRAGLEARAKDQQERLIVDPARRGDILDRNGHILAQSADADSIFAVPSAIKNPEAVVAQLCNALRDCDQQERQTFVRRLSSRSAFAWVRRRVTPDQVARVADLKIKAVNFKPESRRFYPNKELAAHILGYVGTDNIGLGGIENAYNNQIRGQNGQAVLRVDSKGQVFSRTENPPTPGATIELTIDKTLQHIAERELRIAVQENRAAGGSLIMIDPRTGEILAMANEPTFDPNTDLDPFDPRLSNRAIQGFYEPGSTFKLVTAAASIEEHVVPLDLIINTSPGYIKVQSGVFHDTSNHGSLSFKEVIADSSNVGAIKVGLQVGIERMSRYVKAFGFGQRLAPDFRNESPGRIWPASAWKELTLASVSIGYQVGVTPLQMVGAVGAIANGGSYMEPRVVRALYQDNKRHAVTPKVLRQPISAETAATLTGIMEEVVESGTGTKAQISGFTVAGKTGTAQKVENGRYSSNYNASFVGFVPSRNPRLAMIVVIDSPKAQGYYGGVVSAPVFQRVAVAALRHLGVAPTINAPAPVLLARTETLPSADRTPAVKLVLTTPPGTVPDLSGLGARDAMREITKLGLDPDVKGTGVVVSQSPLPGTPIDEGETVYVKLDRTAASTGNRR